MTDHPDWDSYPTALSYACDAYPRRHCYFTGGAVYHAGARKWIPVGKAVRIDSNLEAASPDSTAGSLIIKPGCEALVNAALTDAPVIRLGPGAIGNGQRRDEVVTVQHR